ncbi:MAG: hypothetical protein Q8Q31_04610 [Nanoarchaeota archaeon]|nr:hypothetical protein [Nanoarchaeota archaeon]
MKFNKSKLKKWALIGLAGMLGTVAIDGLYRGKNSIPAQTVTMIQSYIPGTIPNLEDRISEFHRAHDVSHEEINRLIVSLEKSSQNAIVFDKSGLRVLEDDYSEENLSEILQGNTIVCKSDSQFAGYFIDKLHPQDKENVKTSVKYIIFSPNVVNRIGSSHEDVNGLSIGGGIILIDTLADDSSIKNPKTFGGVIAHEAQHEKDRDKRYPTLTSEKRAYQSGARTLEFIAQNDRDSILKATLTRAKDTIKTAEYLERFGSDFSRVYPSGTILAKDLLEADINIQTLSKHKSREDKTKKDLELICAASFAEVIRLQSREEALKILYPYASEKKFAGTIVQISAASAIAYLCPNACKTESSGDIAEKGFHLSLQDRRNGRKTNHLGQGSEGEEGYSVSGLPSLQELLEDQRFEDYETGGEYPAAIYQLAQVDKIKVKISVDGVKLVYLPNREGKPSAQFFRAYVELVDANQNGRADEIRVYYFNDNVVNGDGSALAKIDVYNGLGQYISSGVTWFAARSKGRDLQFNPREEALKRNMELIPQSK